MPKNIYECMFILDANAYARNPAGAAESVSRMVDQVNGELLASRLWNEQKLAYPIKGRHKGAYWLSYAKLDSDQVSDFNRACQLNDIVLRHLIIKIDPRLADTLVSAAKGESALPKPDATAEVSEKADDEDAGGEMTSEAASEKAAAVDG